MFLLFVSALCYLNWAIAYTPPAEIEAIVAFSATNRSLRRLQTPQLGDLHKKFTNLPDSCEVLVAVETSSVNPADLYMSPPFPQIIGSDLAGTVVAKQDSCKRLNLGDKVWADIGAVTKIGTAKTKENGAYAQLAVALESQVGPMPSNLDFQEAGVMPKVSLTSYKALVWYGGAPYTHSNGTILILGGSSGTGTAGIQLAKAFGASTIITTTSASNVAYVTKLGATQAIDYHQHNWYDVIDDASVNVIYDCVGQKDTGDQAMAKLVSGGFYVTLRGAVPSKPRSDVTTSAFINSDTNLDNLNLLEALRELVEADKLRMPSVKAYPLQQAEAAFKESQEGHVVGKLAINIPPVPEEIWG